MTSQAYNPADNQMAPEHDLTAWQDDDAAPEDDQIMPADEQTAGEVPEPEPAGAWPAGDLGPPAAAVRESPGLALVPSVAPVTDAGPEPVLARTRTSSSGHAAAGDSWHEIKATFVDDPRASTALAASLVSDRVDALVTSVRDRQLTLQSAWQGQDAGTEELRMTLQNYRAFWNQIEDFPAEA